MKTQHERLWEERIYGGTTMDERKRFTDLTLREILDMLEKSENNQRDINITINYDYSNSIIVKR